MKKSPIEELYAQLDDDKRSLAERKHILRSFLRHQREQQQHHPERGMELAYEIAGLLSTSMARTLPDDDPYSQAMNFAGNLELPEQHRGGASWREIARLIDALPGEDI